MKKQLIEVERLSDEKQVQVISEVFGLTIEKATEMADAIYSRGMEIVKTEGGKIEDTDIPTNQDHFYYLTKIFLRGEKTIRELADQEGVSYNKMHAVITQQIKLASGERPHFLHGKHSRDKYLEFFK